MGAVVLWCCSFGGAMWLQGLEQAWSGNRIRQCLSKWAKSRALSFAWRLAQNLGTKHQQHFSISWWRWACKICKVSGWLLKRTEGMCAAKIYGRRSLCSSTNVADPRTQSRQCNAYRYLECLRHTLQILEQFRMTVDTTCPRYTDTNTDTNTDADRQHLYITFYMECNRIRHVAPNFDSVSKLDHELQTSKAQRDLDQILEQHVSNSCVRECDSLKLLPMPCQQTSPNVFWTFDESI